MCWKIASIALAATLLLSSPSGAQQHAPANQVHHCTRRDTGNSRDCPLFTQPVQAPESQQDAAQRAAADERKDNTDRQIADYTGKLFWATVALGIVGALQFLTLGAQALLLRRTVQDSAASINQATRAATAMEGVAASMEINAAKIVESVETSKQIAATQRAHGEMQMRAYVSVLLGGATYQDANNNFEARPVIRNTGMTEARNVKWRMYADVLPSPLPDSYKFKLPPRRKGSSLLVPHSPDMNLSYIMTYRVPDAEVEDIKRTRGHALYAWGLLAYEDVFGKRHRVTFCQQMRWLLPDDIVTGYYVHRHNKAQ